MLSLQASYAAPLILLAQNRQADRDRVQYEQDRARAERNIADTDYLTRELAALRIAVGDVATRDFLRSELRQLLEELGPERRRPSSAGRRPSGLTQPEKSSKKSAAGADLLEGTPTASAARDAPRPAPSRAVATAPTARRRRRRARRRRGVIDRGGARGSPGRSSATALGSPPPARPGLVDNDLANEREVADALGELFGLPVVALTAEVISPEAGGCSPRRSPCATAC